MRTRPSASRTPTPTSSPSARRVTPPVGTTPPALGATTTSKAASVPYSVGAGGPVTVVLLAATTSWSSGAESAGRWPASPA